MSSCSAARPSLWEHDAPLFDLGISPPTSQPTPPTSQPTVTQLEILVEVVLDVGGGVAAALKFADMTSAEPSFTAAEGYRTPEKERNHRGCYHWMTHVKETKDSTNEYDVIFVLNHEANFEGIRHHFLSLMPEQHVESTVVNAHCMILNDIKCPSFRKKYTNYIDLKTNKAYRMDVDQYVQYYRFLDKRKFPSHPFLFVPICNGGHWWLWIADVQKKAFYVFDPVNKKKDEIPDLRIKLNKFINMNKVQFIVVADLYSSHPFVFTWEEIDAFRRKYSPNILLHKLNKTRDQVIWESEAIRLPKPSAALSSPFCKFTYGDIDSLIPVCSWQASCSDTWRALKVVHIVQRRFFVG
ncbi:hypothetical protein Ahy_B05g078737 [Arachis hypogaea]|uniref:Ubiquitin-like protease family profile domain-containing protein n=1 Tax=Arachis hypogaea TaxID=3818 RepID=A0A444Z7Y1_ARAHY|nr:hypothetical protein Ahy_B05g078737 [Arachis hypogaea]